MEEPLNRMLPFKEPSLKRDDLISVLDALASRQVFPGKVYENAIDILHEKLGVKNILLVSSKWIATQLVTQILLEEKIKNIYVANDSPLLYLNIFSTFAQKIQPLDITQYSLDFDVQSIALSDSLLFFTYNNGYPKDLSFIKSIDMPTMVDLSGSLFTRFRNNFLFKDLDYVICSFKEEEVITSGDGAAIIIKDDKKFEKIRNLAYENNLLLCDFNCSLLISQILKLNSIKNSRKKLFYAICEKVPPFDERFSSFDSRAILYRDFIKQQDYDKNLIDEEGSENYLNGNNGKSHFDEKKMKIYKNISLQNFKEEMEDESSFTTFCIGVENIPLALQIAKSMGIEIRTAISKPVSLELKMMVSFEKSEFIAKHAIMLPFYPSLKVENVNSIITLINKILTY